MLDIVRDSTLGQMIRLVSHGRYFPYIDESPNFKMPHPVPPIRKATNENKEHVENLVPQNSSDSQTIISATRHIEADLERQLSRREPALPRTTFTSPIDPIITSDGITLVDWYSTDDQDNPLNWSLAKRIFISAQILAYTFTIYLGSSIFAPGIEGVKAEFGVGDTAAYLGLALYVAGYGIGPMLFSPLSEVPAIGRNPPYILNLFIFVILIIPTSLTPSFGGLLVCRFLLGFFGSPCLATGPASLLDLFPLIKIPYLLSLWAAAATLGPALGPVIGGFTAQYEGWRWTEWEILWLSGPIFITMIISLPETSASTILYKRSARLRKTFNTEKLRSQSEIDHEKMTLGQISYAALLVPWKINFFDPAVAFSTLYTALVYAIYYSFFESLPLVFPVMYGFNLGQSGLPFLSILVCLAIAAISYNFYMYQTVEKPFTKHGFSAPESRLVPGLWASCIVPIGLFLFAWTARPSVHWIVPVIGLGLSVTGVYIVLQSMFLYLPFTYPQHSASLFAANDLARSLLAGAAILFSRPMFLALGIGGGVSLLGGMTVVCIWGIYYLYLYGHQLREKSRFATH